MKKKLFVFTMIIVLMFVLAYLCSEYIKSEGIYTQAIKYIQEKKYALAVEQLMILNKHEVDDNDYVRGEPYDEMSALCYKDSAVLLAYALAKDGERKKQVPEYLDNFVRYIPDDYDRTLSDEIVAFKNKFYNEHKEYLLELSQRRASKKKTEEIDIKNSVPYIGMSESKIRDTVLGDNIRCTYDTEIVNGVEKHAKIYNFYIRDQKIFEAKCIHERVVSVKDYRSTYKSSSGTGVKNGTGKEPYGINDYDTPEDFYEDNRDEFWDYDEAQRYYNRYHENP